MLIFLLARHNSILLIFSRKKKSAQHKFVLLSACPFHLFLDPVLVTCHSTIILYTNTSMNHPHISTCTASVNICHFLFLSWILKPCYLCKLAQDNHFRLQTSSKILIEVIHIYNQYLCSSHSEPKFTCMCSNILFEQKGTPRRICLVLRKMLRLYEDINPSKSFAAW